MNNTVLHLAGSTAALRFAEQDLADRGYALSPEPSEAVTHLLLPVPSFDPSGSIKGGGNIEDILKLLPKNITIIGGNLGNTALCAGKRIDLLQDSIYLAENAAITAECALQAAAPHLHTTFADSPALILGCGRIGKCLAKLLKVIGCPVTVAARKQQDRAMLKVLGYEAVDFP